MPRYVPLNRDEVRESVDALTLLLENGNDVGKLQRDERKALKLAIRLMRERLGLDVQVIG